MSHKAKVSGSEKIAAVEKYLRGEDSLNHLASLLDVRHSSVRQWLQTYQSLGQTDCFKHHRMHLTAQS
ncbi:helix-turn-helix domain-containing protein [Paenibacillus larvae]|uniref:helix-turn-helix domain-containing protein n=1 Tax=Paenibacillus larvae TaxID=1464 RepID=UPI0013143695|nr:helix-turn-helix domain-containing protein [Paenibacillus larvae]